MASWWFAKADTETSTTSTSYVEKHTLDFTAPAAGDYLIFVSASMYNENNTISAGIRAQLDNTTTIMEGLYEPSTSSSPEEDYRNFSTVYLAESLASGAHYVDIDILTESASYNTYIRYMKIAVIRLDDWLPTTGMYAYTNTEAETDIRDWTTLETLTFTPDTAGDYLILGSCEAKVGVAGNSIVLRLNYDSGAEYLPVANAEEGMTYLDYEDRDITDYHSFVWGGIVSLPASEKTILMEGKTLNTQYPVGRKRRIIAIRLAAMDSGVVTDEDAANTSTSSQWTTKSSIDFTPTSTEDYLIFGGMLIKPDMTGPAGDIRLNHVTGTATGVIGEHGHYSQDPAGYADCTPLFTVEVKSLTNTQQVIETQWGYGDDTSGLHYGKGSFIVAIRKPSSETTAYKDVPLKISIESEDIFKDVPLKLGIESEDIYKDLPLKLSVESADSYKDLPLKVSMDIEVFKDVPLKTSIESAFTYQDVPLKITVSAEVFKDIPLKVSILVTYKLTGTTKDNDGNVLGSCKCYLSKDNLDNTFIPMAYQLSDAGTGIYVFGGLLDNDPNYQVIGWKDGSPNIFDVTDWILTPEIE